MIETSEIFHSIQGEGPFMGKPAVFLRLSGCVPPFCSWCDTEYAQGPGIKTGIYEIIEKIRTFGCNFVVITGGEPYLQWNSGLKDLEKRLIGLGYDLQYETSGKLEIPDDSEGFKVCSPKFIRGMWFFSYENLEAVDVFKFVTGRNNHDYDNIMNFVEKNGILKEKVWIMPFGANRDEQLSLLQDIWIFCMDNGFNFSPRLHILAFDTKKGI